MNRCQECDSQVADNDLFCPYCGSRIEAGSEAAPNEPDGGEASANATTEPSMIDVPIPELVSDFSRTSDNVTPPSTSEFSLSSGERHAVSDPEDESAIGGNAADDPIQPMDGSLAEQPGIYDERPPYSSEGISKPLQELEEAEAPKSVFDSVRIMEQKPQDDVETRIQGSSGPIPEAPMPALLSET